MKVFSVYVNPAEENSLEKAVFVKEGFSFPATIFGFLWSLYHKLWAFTALIVALNFLVSFAESRGLVGKEASAILGFGAIILVGYLANDFLAKGLEKKGLKLFDIVSGSDKPEAERRFFSAYANDSQA